MKKSAILFTILTALALTGCGNNTATTPASSSKASTVAPSSSVAEVKDDYIAIGGKTPYEVLTATQEANIKKAEAEAQKQAEEARLQAEAKKKAEAQKQAEQQAQANAEQNNQSEQVEQPQQVAEAMPKMIPGQINGVINGIRVTSQEDVRRAIEQGIAELEARGYYGKNKDDVPPEWKQQRQGSGVVATE